MAAAGSVFSRAELDYLHGQRLLGRIASVATATALGLLGPPAAQPTRPRSPAATPPPCAAPRCWP
jgi:hypothetical protein